MVKAAKYLKMSYPRMIHITCVAHKSSMKCIHFYHHPTIPKLIVLTSHDTVHVSYSKCWVYLTVRSTNISSIVDQWFSTILPQTAFAKAQSAMEEHMVRATLRLQQPVWLYAGGAPNHTVFFNHGQGEVWQELNEWEYEMIWRDGVENWRMLVEWNLRNRRTPRKT